VSKTDEDAWVERVLGFAFGEGDPEQALQRWRAAREDAVAALRQLKGAIGASKDPESTPARILVDAIIKNLTPVPDTLNAISELERYLQTDDIIGIAEQPNGYGIAVTLRASLLPPLRALRTGR
jgi:hypothetical protein